MQLGKLNSMVRKKVIELCHFLRRLDRMHIKIAPTPTAPALAQPAIYSTFKIVQPLWHASLEEVAQLSWSTISSTYIDAIYRPNEQNSCRYWTVFSVGVTSSRKNSADYTGSSITLINTSATCKFENCAPVSSYPKINAHTLPMVESTVNHNYFGNGQDSTGNVELY